MQSDFARVAVVGTSCSGKTTFARALAERLGAPHVELDALYWQEGWRPRGGQEFRKLVEQATSPERWVADGNYDSVRRRVWGRATTVVWLDYPFALIFGRALWRTLRRTLTAEELYAGNRESLRRAFLSRDSILLWVATSHRRRRAQILEERASGRHPELRVVQLRWPSEAAALLDGLARSTPR